MKFFKKKTPPPPATNTEPAHEEETMEASQFSFRRGASSTNTTPEDIPYYNEMDDAKSVELTAPSVTPQVQEKTDVPSQQSLEASSCVAEEKVREEDKLSWTTFFCLWIWCAIPCAAYILLFTVRDFISPGFIALFL
jgi:hypothetical protein